MNKFGLRKLLAVWVVAFACVCMWGCSEDKVRWHEGFTGTRIVGFVNDSLVMVGSLQQRTESHEGTFEPYWDVIELGHERLCVYNYRIQEDGPRWCDTLGEYNTTNAFRGQMTDSIIWGGDMPNSIRLWKVGETQHLIKLKKITEGCSSEFGISSVKQWLDGTFIVRGEKSLNAGDDSCQYAVLDTVEKVLTYKRLEKKLEWIRKCDDVRVWGMDVHCLLRKKENLSVLLSVNNMIVDSLETDDKEKYAVYPALFAGNMLYLGENVCSLEKMKMKKYPNVQTYLDEIKFINSGNTIVSY